MQRWRPVEVIGALLVLLSAGCGAPRHNEFDATFVSRMIPHHHLGMELIDEATQRSDDVRLRRLVFEMGTYHHDELAALEKWAADWGTSPAATFPGDIEASSVDRLQGYSGRAHDTWWLHLMISHHRGAILSSRAEAAGGIFAEATDMAGTIEKIQSRQIDEMSSLLRELCDGATTLPGC